MAEDKLKKAKKDNSEASVLKIESEVDSPEIARFVTIICNDHKNNFLLWIEHLVTSPIFKQFL